MNKHTISSLVAGFVIAAASWSEAGLGDPALRGIATVSSEQVILDVFVDAGEAELRAFGFRALFNPDELRFTSGGRYASLWFLRDETGDNSPYTDVTEPGPGVVRVVGGRFDGANPEEGVSGDDLLLATLVFERLDNDSPKIELTLAGPPPYVSFALAGGEPLDSAVMLEEVTIQDAAEDTDNDGLPDAHEIEVYGDLTTSDGESDTDSDGVNDRDEWLHGTDGTELKSRFQLDIIPQPDGSKLVVWTGGLGRVYDLEWSPHLRNFTTIASGIEGLDGPIELLDDEHNSVSAGFYRVRTRFSASGP